MTRFNQVKIPKLVILIVRLRYSYRKQIKINYEVQFLTDPILNDEIEKEKEYKKQLESTRVNLLSNILGSYD